MPFDPPAPKAAPASPPGPRVAPALLAFALLAAGVVATSALVMGLWARAELARRGTVFEHRFQWQSRLREVMDALQVQPRVLLVITSLSTLLVLGAALLCAARSPVPWRLRLGLTPARRLRPGVAVLALLTLGLFGECVTSLLHQARQWKSLEQLELLGTVTRAATPGELALLLVVVALGAGVAEELFFRGYLQTRFVERWGRWKGVTLAALAFGLLHFDPLHSSLAFVMGWVLGWIAEQAGSVRPAIWVHVLNNVVALCYARWFPFFLARDERWVWLALCSTAFAVCARLLWRSLRREGDVPSAELTAAPGP